MKTIYIFLASSITELSGEREKLYKYLSGPALRELFRNDNTDIQLVNCEHLEDGYTGVPSQQILDVSLEDCPISIFLFKAKNKEDAEITMESTLQKGKGTEEEFNVALKCAKEGKQTVFIYYLTGSKKISSKKQFNKHVESLIDENGIYKTICSNIDEVNSSVIIRLLKYEHEWLCSIGDKYKKNSPSLHNNTEIEFNWKNGVDLYGLYSWHNDKREELQALIHSTIDTIMKSIKKEINSKSKKYKPGVPENLHIINVYNDISSWAEQTAYDMEKQYELLSDYKMFLNKIRQFNSELDIYQKQIILVERINGLDSLITAYNYKNIGSVFFQRKKYEEAIKYLEKSLKIYDSYPETNSSEKETIQQMIFDAKTRLEELGGKKKSLVLQ